LGEEPVDQGGPVLDAFEPVLDDRGELVHVAGGEVAQAFFMFAQAPSAALRSGASGSRTSVSQSRWASM
jgi:hypothetical protein